MEKTPKSGEKLTMHNLTVVTSYMQPWIDSNAISTAEWLVSLGVSVSA